MPIINGGKWACTSCIKGHRVSGCTHQGNDQLTFILLSESVIDSTHLYANIDEQNANYFI